MTPADPFLPLKVKRFLSEELARLYQDMAGRRARFKVPFKTIFLCGGYISVDGPAVSLRDYLHRKRGMRLRATTILAETANQLYRDTSYSDLISFEEDIARIATLVLVIAESPGSLAELGAFSMNDTIRGSMRVIAQSRYSNAESFIRYGPIEKVRNGNINDVGFYPWETNKSGTLIKKSASPHYMAMKQFIADGVSNAPETRQMDQEYQVQKFFVVYWCTYLSYAASQTVILEAVRRIYPAMLAGELKNILYCLKLVKWIDSETYINKEYFFALGSEDPIEYRFPRDFPRREMLPRRLQVRRDFENVERLPKHVMGVVAARRAALL